jgi:hypothetical protein
LAAKPSGTAEGRCKDDEIMRVLKLWARMDAAYQLLTKEMFDCGGDQLEMEMISDLANVLRKRAVRLTKDLLA